MSDTTVTTPPEPAPPGSRPSTRGDKVRFVLRGIGQTLITLGCVVLLFAVYEVWITNIFAAREQKRVTKSLYEQWNKDDRLALPGSADPTVPLGSGMAVLYIPRLGRDYHFTIVQGSPIPDDSQLEEGPAHYENTALPGQKGNFAIAGHRVGKGEPFLNIDKLRSGDAVIVETRRAWFVYRVLGKPTGKNPQHVTEAVATKGGTVTLPGREIIDPSHGDVLDPVPENPGKTPATALMTMTTCHPKFTAQQRMIVYSKLLSTLPNTNFRKMPASVLALYDEVKA